MNKKQENFTLMGGRVIIHPGKYNPTCDAVWLAAWATGAFIDVLDIGIGTGGVSLCLMANHPGIHITGLDISPDMLAQCAQNAELNNQQLELVNDDIMKWKTDRTFDLVISNPPYFQGTPARHNAHHNADLDGWIKKSVARVRPRGQICVIIDSGAVATVVSGLRNNHCGGITIFPLFGAKDTAERVLIRARQGVKTGSVIHHGLPMNYEPILRDGLTIESALSTLGQK